MLQSQKTLEGMRNILSDEQNLRLNQLVLQRLGVNAVFVREPAVASLKLDENQLSQLREIRRRRGPRGKDGEQSPHDRFLQLLTPEQRRVWEELVGEPFFPPPSLHRSGRVRSFEFPGLGSPVSLTKYHWVRRELDLSDEQREKMDDVFATWDERQLWAQEQMLAGSQGDEWQAVAVSLRQAASETSSSIQEILSPAQSSRLDQLAIQRQGLFALTKPEIVRELDLDAEQKRQIDALVARFQMSLGQLRIPVDSPEGIEKSRQTRKQLLDEALQLLSEEQRRKWHALVGELVEVDSET